VRLYLFVKLNYESTSTYYSLALDILCVTYFLALITLPDPPISDVRQIR